MLDLGGIAVPREVGGLGLLLHGAPPDTWRKGAGTGRHRGVRPDSRPARGPCAPAGRSGRNLMPPRPVAPPHAQPTKLAHGHAPEYVLSRANGSGPHGPKTQRTSAPASDGCHSPILVTGVWPKPLFAHMNLDVCPVLARFISFATPRNEVMTQQSLSIQRVLTDPVELSTNNRLTGFPAPMVRSIHVRSSGDGEGIWMRARARKVTIGTADRPGVLVREQERDIRPVDRRGSAQ